MPSTTPGTPTGINPYPYELGTSLTFNWTAAPADSEGVVPSYKIAVTVNGNTTYYFTSNTSLTITGSLGQSYNITIQAVNPNDQTVTGPPPSNPLQIKLLDPNGD